MKGGLSSRSDRGPCTSAESEAAEGGPGQPPSPTGRRLAAMEAGADGRALLPAGTPASATTSPTRLRTGHAVAAQRVISDWSYPSSTLTTPNTTAAAQCVAASWHFLSGAFSWPLWSTAVVRC